MAERIMVCWETVREYKTSKSRLRHTATTRHAKDFGEVGYPGNMEKAEAFMASKRAKGYTARISK